VVADFRCPECGNTCRVTVPPSIQLPAVLEVRCQVCGCDMQPADAGRDGLEALAAELAETWGTDRCAEIRVWRDMPPEIQDSWRAVARRALVLLVKPR